VILKHEHNTNQAEVVVAWRHHEVAGESEHADLFTAVHAAIGKVHAQIVRQREKMRDMKRVPVQ
jgi:ribosome-associated translation inhibitor RaiA